MNIMYLSLYGVAAVVLVVVFIRTCLERDKMTRIVCLTEMLALICIVTYSVNFITDNYMAMSVATSIMMAAQDFALVNVYRHIYKACKQDNQNCSCFVHICGNG
mgnify:CR=1 FL=1